MNTWRPSARKAALIATTTRTRCPPRRSNAFRQQSPQAIVHNPSTDTCAPKRIGQVTCRSLGHRSQRVHSATWNPNSVAARRKARQAGLATDPRTISRFGSGEHSAGPVAGTCGGLAHSVSRFVGRTFILENGVQPRMNLARRSRTQSPDQIGIHRRDAKGRRDHRPGTSAELRVSAVDEGATKFPRPEKTLRDSGADLGQWSVVSSQ